MWLTVELFGVTVFAVGVGRRAKARWITNVDGSFELAPDDPAEYEDDEVEECGFGFH